MKKIEGDFLFCPHCGSSIQQEVVEKEVEADKFFDDVVLFVMSHLNECQVEKKVVGNYYTAIFYLKKKNGQKIEMPCITLEMIIQMNLCGVYFNYSKARPALNAVVAAAAAPIYLPASGILLGTAGLRLWHGNNLKKDVMRYIKEYIS